MNTSKTVDDKTQKESIKGEKQEHQVKHKEPIREITEEERNKLIEQLRQGAVDDLDLWGE